ncbi:hypothetical protein V8E55_003452 [Tylopilus felleus]|jgi:hypothetical protein
MSSAAQFALLTLLQNDYLSVAMLTAVGYDYLLTFSDEIEYIWTKPWTWVSTMFVLVRYAGLCSFTTTTILGCSLLPGIPMVCEITYIIHLWAFLLFVGAADFVTILRVWALYNRSRYLLGALVTLFSLEMISYTLAACIRSNPKNLSTGTSLILDIVICFVTPISPIFPEMNTVFEFTHGTTVFVLAIVHFVRQSLQMHRTTKQWKPDPYMSLLVAHNILYFIAIFSSTFIGLLDLLGKLPTKGWSVLLILIIYSVPVYTLAPRFILNIRELCARNVQGTRGEGIDTGFGLSTGSSGTEMAFADLPNEGFEDDVLGTGGNGMDTGFGLSSSGRGTIEMGTMCADVERSERLEGVEV